MHVTKAVSCLVFKQNSIDALLFLKLLLAIVEGKLFKKLCAPFIITYTMVSWNLFPHTCTPTHNTKKKKSYVACFLGYKSILCLFVAYKNINPKELSPCENQGKRDWVGWWESLCQTRIFLQLHMLSRALSLPQYTYSLWQLMWQYSAMVTGEAPPQSNSDSVVSSPRSRSPRSRSTTSGGSAHCLMNWCFAAFLEHCKTQCLHRNSTAAANLPHDVMFGSRLTASLIWTLLTQVIYTDNWELPLQQSLEWY